MEQYEYIIAQIKDVLTSAKDILKDGRTFRHAGINFHAVPVDRYHIVLAQIRKGINTLVQLSQEIEDFIEEEKCREK